jgi:CHASE3 domain sensor protein
MAYLDVSLKWQWLRGLAVWNRLPIRAQGGWLALIPVVAILASFVMAFYGNRNRELLETDIEQKFFVVNRLNEVQNLMVDAETGIRGYMLTKRGEFLEPYRTAITNLPPTLQQLKNLTSIKTDENAREEKLRQLENIEKQIEIRLDYLRDAESSVSRREANEVVYARLQRGKVLMDDFRRMIGEMEAEESFLLNERLQEISRIRWRDYLFVIAALLIGLLARVVSFYLFDRGIVRRIERLAENARCLQRGEEFKFPFSNKTDAVGALEAEIEGLSQILGKNDKVKESN